MKKMMDDKKEIIYMLRRYCFAIEDYWIEQDDDKVARVIEFIQSSLSYNDAKTFIELCLRGVREFARKTDASEIATLIESWTNSLSAIKDTTCDVEKDIITSHIDLSLRFAKKLNELATRMKTQNYKAKSCADIIVERMQCE